MAKIHSLKGGARLPEAIVALAKREGIKTAGVAAIGGVRALTLAYYNHEKRAYEEHPYSEFMEVLVLQGNITIKDRRPFLHAHGAFGRKDMSTVGGHLIEAEVFPLLEVVLTPTANRATREYDPKIGLNVIRDS